jgi:sulfoxide reductase heme-binding subunit YedZ
MLAVAFVAGHVAFTMVQSHADIALADVVVPLAGPSHSLALALGTVAVDLLLAITITSALRRHVGVRAWRAVHATAWGLWPIAALHSVTMGTDAGSWMLWVNLACAAMFAAALGVRRWGGRQSTVSPVVEGAARPASSSAV